MNNVLLIFFYIIYFNICLYFNFFIFIAYNRIIKEQGNVVKIILLILFIILNSILMWLNANMFFSIITSILIQISIIIICFLSANHFKIIGITGQISSGKSVACEFIKEKHNFVILNIDTINKEVLELNDVKQKIKITIDKYREQKVKELNYNNNNNNQNEYEYELYNKPVIDKNGSLDKLLIRKLIYKDKLLIKKIEEITIKKVAIKFIKLVLYYKLIKYKRNLMVEHAILPKVAVFRYICNKILCIICEDQNKLIKRIEKRDNCTAEVALNIINNQFSLDKYKKYSDYVIENNYDFTEFKFKIDKFINSL